MRRRPSLEIMCRWEDYVFARYEADLRITRKGERDIVS